MTREEIREAIRTARTLPACEMAEKELKAYLEEHPDDSDLLMEGESLRLMKTALQHIAAEQKQVVSVG
jgi:hypothetical protein